MLNQHQRQKIQQQVSEIQHQIQSNRHFIEKSISNLRLIAENLSWNKAS